jgi:Ni,Fe-hydrogenase III large subunit
MTATGAFITCGNGEAIETSAVPSMDVQWFRHLVCDEVETGARVAALFARPAARGIELWVVLSDDAGGQLRMARAPLSDRQFPSLTPQCPQVHLFEREIAEQFGVVPGGHPWLKPVRFPQQTLDGTATKHEIGDFEPFRVEGDEVHEVAVGPVHAGIIEPGHFRFQCYGEEVMHLEISLGYQHRGIEAALRSGPNKRTVHYMETLAGDTSIAHTTAYCQAIEGLTGCRVPPRAEAIRGIALELERLANHTGDLGALAGDVGFLPTSSYCGRLRGDFLNATAVLCGNRFGRGLVRPGGVAFDLDASRATDLRQRIEKTMELVTSAINVLWDSPSVMARFEDTGRLTREQCLQMGLVGPAARACGVSRDVRQDQPSGLFQFHQVPVSTWDSGDVFARAYVRWLEIQQSVRFIVEQLQGLPPRGVRVEPAPLEPDRAIVSLVEGWRGEVCHVAITDDAGRLGTYKVVDPSMHNWIGLALALRGQQISDFPLCNKSFNLSYCGHDL